jgi:trk system potassium uptake protein TrkH
VETGTALVAIVACLNNLGAGVGEVALHFADLGDFATWVCSFAMILGRLEVFTFLVLLTPSFWNE